MTSGISTCCYISCKSCKANSSSLAFSQALIAAYEATKDDKFLERAMTVADNCCNRQAGMCKGLVWEHYNEDWDGFFGTF